MGSNPLDKGAKKMSTHFLSLINGWIWEQLGSGGANPCGDSVKKTSIHFLNRLCGWIRTWGMGRGQTHWKRVLRK